MASALVTFFHQRAGMIVVASNAPASHVVLFYCGERLEFLPDASSFDDTRRAYAWAFSKEQPLGVDEFVVFASADRSVVGSRMEKEILATSEVAEIERDENGRPVRVVSIDSAESVEALRKHLAEEGPLPLGEVAAALSEAREVLSKHEVTITRERANVSLPKVSIITCSYNRPDLLREAVESLRAQTDQDWEHLIYDDASTDPRVQETLKWAAEDPRVRVWRGKQNLDRPAVLWNFMMDRAHGRYLTVLDDDNTKLPRFIEVLAGELDRDPSLDIVTCGWLVCRDGRKPDEYYLNLTTNSERLSVGSSCDGGAMLYRRDVFERTGYFSEDMKTNEDWDWLRRAVHTSKVKNLQECHTTYRCHEVQRMTRSGALGSDADIAKLKAKQLTSTLGVKFIRPPRERLTQSQEDVCVGLERALALIPWVVSGNEIALVVSPFQMKDEEIAANVSGCSQIVFLHMEDPYAFVANKDRVRATTTPPWVVTNDVTTVERYQDAVGKQVLVYPSLSPDETISVPSLARDIDVLLCGYAYPSRQRFVDDLLPHLSGRKVVLVGDGWESRTSKTAETMATLSSDLSYIMHARAKTVICAHRVNGDCSDGPDQPRTVNRGFMEGYHGPRVFLDTTRDHHHLDPGDVVWYDGAQDLATKLHTYLDGPRAVEADVFSAKCKLLYTYRTRLARILNSVRGNRYLAEIP